MENNQKTMAFQLKVSNMIAALKFFSQRNVISYGEHFDLWTRLLKVKTHEELDSFVREVQELINKKKGRTSMSNGDVLFQERREER